MSMNREIMIPRRSFLFALFIGLALSACTLPDDELALWVFSESYDFSQGQYDWQADFSDYPATAEDSVNYELKFEYTDRPANLGSGKAIMMSGINHSDDLFMFMKKKITGLEPDTDYNLVFEVELASNAPTGAVGIGGAPGESVYLKVGACYKEPKKVIDEGKYTLNIDKGDQINAGEDMIVLGNIAVAPTTTNYTLITRTNATANAPFVARTNSQGELWIIVGTDSGFEGTTTLYYTKVNIVFSVLY